ncbi:MAG: preprotein translocase subunit SecA [Clostridia bacterium]
MLNFLKNLLDDNERTLKKLQPIVDDINALEAGMQKLSDEELAAKTVEFKNRLRDGETIDQLLREAFAVTREASKRVLNMRHYDVQLLGGIVLHQGRIAEMKTGEGKTLVATLPTYLNALTGQGVHMITVNDYLAHRDSEWMGQVYRFLGLSVGLIVHGVEPAERKISYASDVTFGTNNEFGFDYLRDNMANSLESMVQRPLNYAIVDEVDSILIDEARTPLIISGSAGKPNQLYYTVTKIIPRLKLEDDYVVDEKANAVTLTEKGVARVESMLGIENLYDNTNIELSHHVNSALRAYKLMKRDVDYVVKDGQVIIVDEFTGRLMFGRRFSEGLHQAIEAKENVKIERESQTLATITFQNYFRMYKKIAGMTGTAKTEEPEFQNIYGMDVVQIPTNKPMIRKDSADIVYRTESGKFDAVVDEIVERHATGQPVLVGTISIEKSEELSEKLKRLAIEHNVLNAKYHELEAEIIAAAGQRNTVTIATNMAGRGTDIILGEGVHQLGGLAIIGTERHESRRIDNQLRGRAGRQGDNGCSRFYVALEDELMRLFGADNIIGLLDKLGMDDSTPIENIVVSRSIESAQKKVESRNFDMRKNVLEYDNVMNKQREVIYGERRKVLHGESLRESIENMIEKTIQYGITRFGNQSEFPEEWDLNALMAFARDTFMPSVEVTIEDIKALSKKEVLDLFVSTSKLLYERKEEQVGAEMMRELERMVILNVVDKHWMEHLDAMDQLRQGIGLRAYGQRDPLIEYKYESADMYQNMIEGIQEDVTRYIYRVNIVQEHEEVREVHENRNEEEVIKKPIRNSGKVGRNDACSCGSGKKFKNCCGANKNA